MSDERAKSAFNLGKLLFACLPLLFLAYYVRPGREGVPREPLSEPKSSLPLVKMTGNAAFDSLQRERGELHEMSRQYNEVRADLAGLIAQADAIKARLADGTTTDEEGDEAKLRGLADAYEPKFALLVEMKVAIEAKQARIEEMEAAR